MKEWYDTATVEEAMANLDRLGTPCRFCGSWALLCRLRYMRLEKIEVDGKVNLVHCCAECQNHGAGDAHRKVEK